MKNSKTLLLATAAAALFTSGQVLAAEEAATPTTEAKVHCGGVNACKGQNKCAGQGMVLLTKEECEKKGGKVLE